MTRYHARRAVALAAALVASVFSAACDREPIGPVDPTRELVAGTYNAHGAFGVLSFTSVTNGVTTDWLAAGATLTLVLDGSGNVAGRLFHPGAGEDGGDMDEDMAGSWTLDRRIVHLEQNADTFMRDLDFTFHDATLTADRTFGDTRVRIVLVQK